MPTYKAIASTTVGAGGASSITFSSIPQTYTDLVLLVSARTDRASTQDDFTLEYNGTTTNGSMRRLYGTGSAAGSDLDSGLQRMGYIDGGNATASTFGNTMLYIPNYTSSNNKSSSSDGVAETNATNVNMAMIANLWSNTAAITSIKLTPATGATLQQYSTATLYGIKNS